MVNQFKATSKGGEILPSSAKSLIKIFNKHKINYWLDQGTLLGLVRDRRLIEGDSDIDLSVWADEIKDAFLPVMADIKSQGFAIKLAHNSFKIFDSLRKVIDVRYNYRRGDFAVKLSICSPEDFMFKLFLCFPFFCLWHICAAPQAWIYTDKHLLSRLNRVLEAVGRIIPRSLRLLLLRGLGGVKNFVQKPFFMVAPASYFSKLEKIKVDEILVNIPSDSKKYLEHKYGKNWRIPNKSWIWWEDDQGICKDDKILDEFLVSLKYYQGWKPYTRKANR